MTLCQQQKVLLLFLWLTGLRVVCEGATVTIVPHSPPPPVADAAPVRVTWLQQLKALRPAVAECVRMTKNSTLQCFKQRGLHLFREMMTAPVIPIWPGIELMQQRRSGEDAEEHGAGWDAQRADLQYLTWFDRAAMILTRALKTHTLQINLKQLTDSHMRRASERVKAMKPGGVGEARVRRHRYNMMITMMFGATALGAILVPMGFQLLSIVSGKALLLAKMALLLASINGLKRVANSGIHYGLYHVPGEQHYGYYDRTDINHPRNVAPAFAAVAQPDVLDVGIRK